MKKINNYMKIGLLLVALTLTLDSFIGLPEFLHGLLIGTGIVFELLGAYAINHDMSKLKKFKCNLVRKFVSK